MHSDRTEIFTGGNLKVWAFGISMTIVGIGVRPYFLSQKMIHELERLPKPALEGTMWCSIIEES